ncbi:MAG: helix-turn-helix domain-containing protein [Rhodocyclaceae bacterium]|nr:helix-turn-helix domain-containing protein [Rhodocyclaceae bacterium]
MKTGSEAGRVGGEVLVEPYWDHPTGPAGAFLWDEDFGTGEASGTTPSANSPNESAGIERLHVFAQHQGRGRVLRGAWQASLEPGDLGLCVDDLLPAAREGPGHQTLMNFPLIGVTAAQREVIRLLPTVLPGTHPGTCLLLKVATDLHQATHQLSRRLPSHFLGGFLSMLAGVLESEIQPKPDSLPRLARFHLERIKSYLRRNLPDADLSAKTVADALGLSVSHVHRVFAFEGCTVSEWLWRERLKGCADDLIQASEAHRSVGEIALAWGFNNLSHFSRSFKKRFGLCPKDWRARAPWRKPLAASALPG